MRALAAAFLGAHDVPPLGPVDVAEFVAGADEMSDLVCERVVCDVEHELVDLAIEEANRSFRL